jgi:hypothetical protein
VATTTFDTLISKHATEKVFLVEIQPKEHLQTWTVYSGDIYYATLDYKLDVQKIEEDGEELTEVSNKNAVTAGEWAYENGVIYLAVSSGTIYSKDLVATYKMYFADEPKIFNNKFYEPFIEGIPSIKQDKSDQFWGVSVISKGQVKLYNHNGYFDEIYNGLAWINQTIQILLGGEDLPYSEYASMFKGKITAKGYQTRRVTFTFNDDKEKLEENLQANTFSAADWPNIEAEHIGRPIPLVWGTVRKMPIACVTGTLGTATSLHTFKIADTSTHSIQAIDQVYVDGIKVNHQSADISAATFKLPTSTYEVGQIVSADIDGYQSGTVLIENPVDVAREIIELLGVEYNDTNFDTATMAIARTDAEDFPIGLVVAEYQRGLDVMGDVMKSCLGTLFVNNTGKFAIKIWDTDLEEALTEISEADIIQNGLTIDARFDDIRKTVRVGWRKNWIEGKYAYKQQSTVITERVFGITKSRTITTLLTTSNAAQNWVDKVGLMMQNATTKVKVITKMQLADKNVGDRIRLSFKRKADDENYGWLNEQPMEILQINKQYQKGQTIVLLDNLRGIGRGIGHWTADLPAFPSYLGGTGEEWDEEWGDNKTKYASEQWGYWTDDDGFANVSDNRSKDISRWW